MKIIKPKFGRYLFFKKKISCAYFSALDNGVKLVTDFDCIKYNNFGLKKNTMERMVQNGAELFVCFDGELPLGMMWGHRGSCYVKGPGLSIIQDFNSVYWFWVFTSPEHRGKNVFRRLQRFFSNHYFDASEFVLLVDPLNDVMIREMHNSGFITAKKIYYIKFCKISFLLEMYQLNNRARVKISRGNKFNLFEI